MVGILTRWVSIATVAEAIGLCEDELADIICAGLVNGIYVSDRGWQIQLPFIVLRKTAHGYEIEAPARVVDGELTPASEKLLMPITAEGSALTRLADDLTLLMAGEIVASAVRFPEQLPFRRVHRALLESLRDALDGVGEPQSTDPHLSQSASA